MSKKLQEINTYFGNDLGNRIETGPVQFGQDWPGVFIRGDSAFAYAMSLRTYLKNPEYPLSRHQLEGLAALLESCNVRNLQKKQDSAQEPGSAVVDSDVQA